RRHDRRGAEEPPGAGRLASGPLDRDSAERDVPGGQAVRLEDDDVRVGLPARQLSGDDLLQLVHLEPVERARLDRLDQVGRLDSRLLERVAADERGTLERDVVELATARM